MLRSPIRRSLILAACLVASALAFAGCGPAGGVQPGIPSDTTAPVNPTPDMGPTPPVPPAKK